MAAAMAAAAAAAAAVAAVAAVAAAVAAVAAGRLPISATVDILLSSRRAKLAGDLSMCCLFCSHLNANNAMIRQ